MSVTDRNSILEAIINWANCNGEKVEKAYNSKGGWEGWVQVELAIVLQQVFGGAGNARVTREDLVYKGTSQRSDLLITTHKSNGEEFTNMFELKCESSHSPDKFRTEVKKDCEKVEAGVWNASFMPCKSWIVAIGVTVPSTIRDLKVNGNELKEYHRKIEAGKTPMTLWWGEGHE